MNEVNRTLYIPLYGKAEVSKKGILLKDPKAEEIWAKEGFALKGKAKSKWLTYYMGMRSAVFDDWIRMQMEEEPDAVVLHLGCGLDSRVERIGDVEHAWYDVDFPEVIEERKKYYQETESYHMIGADVRDEEWLKQLPKGNAIIVMEGLSMYLNASELRDLMIRFNRHFVKVRLLMDCYTKFAAKASKYKNPINEVGVTQVYGYDTPETMARKTGLRFVKEHELTPEEKIDELQGYEKVFFKRLMGGYVAKKMYRLYEFEF